MQIAQIAPAQARADVPPPASPRTEAAKALVAVPMGAVMVATMTAMSKQMSGQTTASRAELVAGLFQKASAEQLTQALLSAIDGAVAVAPELADRTEAMKQAATGVVALLQEAAADTAQAPIAESMDKLTKPLQEVAAPLLQAALVLDPNMGKDQPTPPPAPTA
jgi:hypothetical protein